MTWARLGRPLFGEVTSITFGRRASPQRWAAVACEAIAPAPDPKTATITARFQVDGDPLTRYTPGTGRSQCPRCTWRLMSALVAPASIAVWRRKAPCWRAATADTRSRARLSIEGTYRIDLVRSSLSPSPGNLARGERFLRNLARGERALFATRQISGRVIATRQISREPETHYSFSIAWRVWIVSASSGDLSKR